MSDRDDIRTFLAEKPDTVFSRIDVITALAHITPANIDTGLSWMVKNKQATRIKHGHYQYLPDAVVRTPGGQPRPPQEQPVSVEKPAAPKPAWLADDLAPFQRVRMYIQHHGPSKRQALATMLANFCTESLKRIASMCAEGLIHANEQDLIALGPHPKAAQARKHWDPRRERPLPPASNTPAAAVESPASGIGQAPAFEFPRLPTMDSIIEQLEKPMSATVTTLHAQPEAAQQESQAAVANEIADGVQEAVKEFGNGGGGVMMDEPVIIFSMCTKELTVEIAGDDERALAAIRAVLTSLTLSKANGL